MPFKITLIILLILLLFIDIKNLINKIKQFFNK